MVADVRMTASWRSVQSIAKCNRPSLSKRDGSDHLRRALFDEEIAMSNNPQNLRNSLNSRRRGFPLLCRGAAQNLRQLAPIALLTALSACSGPNQKAGREQDRVDATAAGVNLTGEGPNERLGEAQDRVEAADRKAKEATARALQARGEQLRKSADVEADKLDTQAKAIRDTKR